MLGRAISILCVVNVLVTEELMLISSLAPANEAVLGVEEVYFNAPFDAPNLYKGTLSDQLDEAWDNISHGKLVSNSVTTLKLVLCS